MSLFRIGQTVRIDYRNHPRHNYQGRVIAMIEHSDTEGTCKLATAAGEMLVSMAYLRPDAHNRECDRLASWRNCAWQPKEYR